MEKEETDKLYRSLIVPSLVLVLCWIVKSVEVFFGISLADFGLQPRTLEGLKGIVFSPFLHADFKHLSANSVPLFVLLAGLYYYYGEKALKILLLLWLTTGLWVWSFAEGGTNHIGASGIVYALAAFHFTGGALRREPRMMAFSLLVVFLYGSLIWGLMPDMFPGQHISWESHLMGFLAGVLFAFAYRREGWQKIETIWEEEDDDGPDEPAYWKTGSIEDYSPTSTTLQRPSHPDIAYESKEDQSPGKLKTD